MTKKKRKRRSRSVSEKTRRKTRQCKLQRQKPSRSFYDKWRRKTRFREVVAISLHHIHHLKSELVGHFVHKLSTELSNRLENNICVSKCSRIRIERRTRVREQPRDKTILVISRIFTAPDRLPLWRGSHAVSSTYIVIVDSYTLLYRTDRSATGCSREKPSQCLQQHEPRRDSRIYRCTSAHARYPGRLPYFVKSELTGLHKPLPKRSLRDTVTEPPQRTEEGKPFQNGPTRNVTTDLEGKRFSFNCFSDSLVISTTMNRTILTEIFRLIQFPESTVYRYWAYIWWLFLFF